ncbi:MAG: T9SS type A sorting domain-containing protein [Chitinophagaceae bacterium]|nr:MAG: T9SS type A sorting domain-containing protein [Chitinophagaceae bacterium]
MKRISLLLVLGLASFVTRAQVIITQYYEGAGVNKWIELTNVGSSTINLTSPQLKLGLWNLSGSAGSINITGAPTQTYSLTGSLNPGQTILVGNTGNGAEVPYLTAASANQTNNNVIAFNGNDGVALLDASNAVLDAFGTGINASDISYVRLTGIATPNNSFTPAEWSAVSLTTVQTANATESNRLGFHEVTAAAVCTEPTSQPTGLILNSTPNTITGNFSAAIPGADQYLVIRSTSPTLSASPVDGTAYSQGQSFGGGTIVGLYSGTSFTDVGLTASTVYYYYIFALNSEDCSNGPNFLSTGELAGSATTQAIPACATPAVATGLSLTAANNFINGTFTAAPGSNQYLVVISSSSILGASPVNGSNYVAGQAFGSGTVVSFTTGANFTATGLTPNTQYYFFVFSASVECTGQPFYNSTAVTGNATTSNTSTGIPAGYYNGANGLSCQPLKTALKTIISTGANNIGYDGLWTAYQYTDIKPGTPNYIWDIYTDDNNPAVPETYNFVYGVNQNSGTTGPEGLNYNREHTTPKSWFNDAAPMHNDIFHVLPTDSYVNGKRSNFPYGEVTTATYTSIDNQSKLGAGNNFGYTGTVFQPFAAFRGDVARISLYMATRYEDQIISQNWAGANSEAGPAMLTAGEEGLDANQRRLQIYNTWYIKTMFKWLNEDPVSQKEIDRNNAVYYQSGQNNRNPFVDHPEYAALIWQCTGALPVTITDFVAQRQTNWVLLKWYATMESSFRAYDIERSTDGNSFDKIGEIEGRNLANYSFNDNTLPNASIVYYRLKMIDLNGTFRYSKTISVRLNNDLSNAILYPNPTRGPLTLKLTNALKDNGKITVTDVAGRTVREQLVSKGIFSIDVDINKLPQGRYFIRINDAGQVIRQSFVIIQ